MTIRARGGVRRLMEKTILNIHFDYLDTSLHILIIITFIVVIIFDSVSLSEPSLIIVVTD